MNRDSALEYSDSLAQIGSGWWRQVLWASREGIPAALGMSTAEWRDQYYGHLRLPLEERREAVAELASEGMKNTEIADVLGVGEATIRRDKDDASPHDDETATGYEDEPSDASPHDEPSLDDFYEATATPEQKAERDIVRFLADLDDAAATLLLIEPSLAGARREKAVDLIERMRVRLVKSRLEVLR